MNYVRISFTEICYVPALSVSSTECIVTLLIFIVFYIVVFMCEEMMSRLLGLVKFLYF